jgi:D-erythro-7,8-dihydroneopterin triphosphate epimerase
MITIHELAARCIIGINDDERREKQDVLVTVSLYADLQAAGKNDRIEDTVNYREVKKNVLARVEKSSFQLIESLAESVAEQCLAEQKVHAVRVIVEKPSALRFARSVSVEITRDRKAVHP